MTRLFDNARVMAYSSSVTAVSEVLATANENGSSITFYIAPL